MTTLMKSFVMPPIKAHSHPTPFPSNVSKQLRLAIPPSVIPNKLSTYYDHLVSITAGKEQKLFRIHKGLLRYHPSYFRPALNNNFKESHIEAVELPQDEVDVFQAFYIWIYTHRLHDPQSSSVKLSIAGSLKSHEMPLSARLLCKIYVFGDVRGIPGLKSEAIDLLSTRMALTRVGNLGLT